MEKRNFIAKTLKENNLTVIKVVPHLHEVLVGCLYLNKVQLNSKILHYEISDNILYVQGIVTFDNISEFYEFMDKEDKEVYKSTYLLARSKKQLIKFDIMTNNEILNTFEVKANRTIEELKTGHVLYNYEGNVYYLFNNLLQAKEYIENGDQTIPYAVQESIYEDGTEIDNYEWEVFNGFFYESDPKCLKKIRLEWNTYDSHGVMTWEDILISKNLTPERIQSFCEEALETGEDEVNNFLFIVRNNGYHATLFREQIEVYDFSN